MNYDYIICIAKYNTNLVFYNKISKYQKWFHDYILNILSRHS